MKAKMSYKSKKIAIITAIILVLIGGISIGTYFYIRGNTDAEATTGNNTTINNGIIDEQGDDSENNNQNLILKYIIIPGVNDNVNEIDKFFLLLNTIKVKTIAVDIEVQYARKYNNKDVSPHIYLLYDYFQHLADKFQIKILTYSFLSYVLQNRKIKKSFLINNKFLYVWYLNRHNIKSKNIFYKR